MGVVKKINFRGDILGKLRHRNLFLDMEENIHIHYRDLRIEMGRDEFEEFTQIFTKQSNELQKVINDTNYIDGKYANANQNDVRIFTESKLIHDVKYHSQRVSIEECGDGYHLHYRNYKILIDPDDFKKIFDAFRSININENYAQTDTEVNELLIANEVDFLPYHGGISGKILSIAVAKYHAPKVRDIFKYIGFEAGIEENKKIYFNESLKVIVSVDERFSAADYKRMRGISNPQHLINYLTENGSNLSSNDVNLIKCQVLDIYYSITAGKKPCLNPDPHMWLYAPEINKVIFPYAAIELNGKDKAETLYRNWANILSKIKLNFIKPTKISFKNAHQSLLRQSILDSIRENAAAFAGVQRIYTMGSLERKDMGWYKVPFVHGKLVKLGSDIDILIEMHPDREIDVPAHWNLHLPEASNHCSVYHIAQLPISEGKESWEAEFPNIPFTQHLIDAYVHFPSKGHTDVKDDFLKKFGAKIFYDRERDGNIPQYGDHGKIASSIESIYGITKPIVEKIKASTENSVFKVTTPSKKYILKLFKAAGNYNKSKISEHVSYERSLIQELRKLGIDTPDIFPALPNQVENIDSLPTLLFERIDGLVEQRPEYPLLSITKALAQIHVLQLEQSFNIVQNFSFDDVCMLWLPLFSQYENHPDIPIDLKDSFEKLRKFSEKYNPGEVRGELYQSSPFIHLHGDVNPKNVITAPGKSSIFFDFNNAYYGPRICDVLDGAFEFSLAEKYIHLSDFRRFNSFIADYEKEAPLLESEKSKLLNWTELLGLIKFIKEVRVYLQRPTQSLRRKRALALAKYLESGR